MQLLIQQALFTFLLPFVVALGGAWLLGSGRGLSRWIVFAVVLAYGVGYLGNFGVPKLPPIESKEWLLVMALIGALTTAWLWQSRAELPVKLGLLIVTLLLQAKGLIQNSWSPGESILTLSIYLVIGISFMRVFDWLSQALGPIGTAFWASAYFGMASFVFVLGSSVSIGQNSGVFAVTLGGLWMGLWRTKATGATPNLGFILALMMSGFLLNAQGYAELKIAPALLIVAAPFAGLAAGRVFKEHQPLVRALAIIGATIVITAAAVGVAFWQSPKIEL